MKALVYERYGPPESLRFEEVDRPDPGEGEVLVKVRAVSLNASDWETLNGKPLYARIGGPRRPRFRTLGSDIAGPVETNGPGATRFAPGDEVFGDNLARMGGFAEYAIVREKDLAPKPAGLSFVEAAAIPQSGVIALQGIRRHGDVRAGQKVLINGAGGGAGSFAVQLAKLAGAEVTGVDNAGKLDFMRSLGADHVVDYTRADFTRNGERYDLVLDLVAHHSVLAYRRALAPDGRYLYVGGSVATLLQVLLLGPLVRPQDPDAGRPTERTRPARGRAALPGRHGRTRHRPELPARRGAGRAAPPRRRARPRQGGRHGRRRVRIRSATSAVQPVWCEAPRPGAGVAVEVLVERRSGRCQSGSVWNSSTSPYIGPPAVARRGVNSADQPARTGRRRPSLSVRLLAGAGRVLDQQVVAEERGERAAAPRSAGS